MTDRAGLDHTHDVNLKSWVLSANHHDTDFPIQNLPLGIFRRENAQERFRTGIAIGDQILDLTAVAKTGLLSGSAQDLCALEGSTLNALAALGRRALKDLRHGIFALLTADSGGANKKRFALLEQCLVPQSSAEFALQTQIGDYTDFYTSVYHAENIGKQFRVGLPPLTPNFKSIPLAYHGRASTVGISGQTVWRPLGQIIELGGQPAPKFGPVRCLDYELELGVFIGRGSNRGSRIDVDSAEDHVLGMSLLNDWSARDVQMWESVPLGPFLAKNFATTISPWVITLDALTPFRAPSVARGTEEGPAFPYLRSQTNDERGALDIQVQASIETRQMRADGKAPSQLSRTSFRHQYWTVAQMIAHHTVGGCDLRTGDLLGTGTISGPLFEEAGALIELTKGGRAPVTLSSGETRRFLEDDDVVVLKAWCEREGFARIGFGVSRGTVAAALKM